jgi:hypothetical protein
MYKADYQDKSFITAVHINDEEAELLRDFHFKNLEASKKKLEKIRDKSDGSTKYYFQISELQNQIHYHKTSFDEACRIIRYYAISKNQTA